MSPTNRNNKRGDRRARRNKRSGGPSSMLGQLSLSKQFEIKCSQSIPSCIRRIKYGSFAAPNLTAAAINLYPGNMGTAAATLAGIYSRYRVIKAIFKQVPTSGSTTIGRVYMGVVDDTGGEGGSSVIPASMNDITALRCSTNAGLGEDGEFQWKPLDPDRWYYVYTANTYDQRFSVPGTFYSKTEPFGQTGTFSTTIEGYFTLEFAGDVI